MRELVVCQFWATPTKQGLCDLLGYVSPLQHLTERFQQGLSDSVAQKTYFFFQGLWENRVCPENRVFKFKYVQIWIQSA